MYVKLENFKFGLDTRRSVLSSQPGTLQLITDAHINQGGEIEKRKAFVRTAFGATTYGLEVTSSGLTVFGSAAAPALPAGITYQRLQHPDAATAMSSVVWSTSHNGKAFVIALFADGRRFPYYDGTLISDFTAGLILPHLNTNVKIATALTALVNATDSYTAIQQANPNDHKFDAYGIIGNTYEVTTSLVTTIGTLANAKQTNGTPAVEAVAAVGQFTIKGGSANAANKINNVKVNGVDVLNAAVLWTTSNTATAALIAASINTKTSVPDYTATSDGDTVYIYAAVAGTTPNNLVVQVTAAGNVCIGDCALAISGTGFTLNEFNVDGVSLISAAFQAGPNVYPGSGPYASLTAFVTALTTDINANTAAGLTHGYLAFSFANNILISKAVTASDDRVLNVFIKITPAIGGGTGGVGTGGSPIVSGTANPSVVSKSQQVINGGQRVTTDLCTVTVKGGVAPYTHYWQEYAVGSGGGISLLNGSVFGGPVGSTYFYKDGVRKGATYSGTFVDKITDANGQIGYTNIVTVTINGY